jgi:hypothetical protein
MSLLHFQDSETSPIATLTLTPDERKSWLDALSTEAQWPPGAGWV